MCPRKQLRETNELLDRALSHGQRKHSDELRAIAHMWANAGVALGRRALTVIDGHVRTNMHALPRLLLCA